VTRESFIAPLVKRLENGKRGGVTVRAWEHALVAAAAATLGILALASLSPTTQPTRASI
jgi:hypothetical protein